MSLSKYPSSGVTAGGAVFGSDELLKPINDIRKVAGILLAPDAAATILEYLPSLADRLFAISRKAELVVAALEKLPFVKDVRIPNLDRVGALPGGQITFQMKPDLANRAEQVIAANTHDPSFPFALACTFGASFTTFEHFDSRNSGVIRPSPGSDYIKAGRVRIGIGNEDGDCLIDALRFVLLSAHCA
jgi:cystathionine beta-lyase/cystathionine gamma-synthase